MKTIFKVGDVVYNGLRKEVVEEISDGEYPVETNYDAYTSDGRMYSNSEYPTLSFAPYETVWNPENKCLELVGFTQEIPAERPDLEVGDLILVSNNERAWWIVRFERFDNEGLVVTENDQVMITWSYFKKIQILGEYKV